MAESGDKMEAWLAGMKRLSDRTPYDNGDGWVSLGETERNHLIEHRDGVPWYEAPIPSRFHRCTPQTRGLLDDVERCACGAMRFRHGRGSGVWGERNSRRKPALARLP